MHHLLTPQEMAEADRLAIAAGTPVGMLVERAGRAVAASAQSMVPRGAQIVVLCGPGNNGADGWVAARCLQSRGYRVSVASVDLSKAADLNRNLSAQVHCPVCGLSEIAFDQADLVIDAIYGAGLSRPVADEAAACLKRLSSSEAKILAVDVPSGLDGASGKVAGFAVKADKTVTFFRMKPGHLLQPGRDLCGEVELVDIGIDPACLELISPQITRNDPVLWQNFIPQLHSETHKYQRGSVLVLSHRLEFAGAARLSAKTALKSGAGLVTVALPRDAMAAMAASSDAIMMRECEHPDDFARILDDPRRNALVIGPGLGVEGEEREQTRAFVRLGVAARRALVLDASGLSVFAGEAGLLSQGIAGANAAPGQEPVLTPHDGEFKFLFKGLDDVFRPLSKCVQAVNAAKFMKAVIVYKGADTVIAAPDGRVAINHNGTPWLATAGSGDVLSGLIASLRAQGMPSFEAACFGVWCHAEAGQALGPYLTADDLPQAVQSVLRGLSHQVV